MPDQFEPLSSMDAAILGIEDKTNLMLVSGVLTFAQPLDVEMLKAVLQERWLKHRRLRQRIVQPGLPMAWPYWEDDPNFSLNAHVHRVALPEPGDQAALQAMASDLVSTPLDYSKPLWQMHVIENYGEGGALLFRIHHAIGDGAALSGLLMSVTDVAGEEAELRPEMDGEVETAVSAGSGQSVSSSTQAASPSSNGQKPVTTPQLAKQAAFAARFSRHFAKKFVIAGLDILSDPEKTGEYVNKGLAYTQSSMQLALKILEPETVFPNQLGVSKRVAWSRPFSLAEINNLRRTQGGTLNDIMVTAVVGGLRRYMLAHGKPVNGVRFRAAVPISLRKNGSKPSLGNKFGVVFLSVPLAMADPQERLAEVRAGMDLLKQSADAQTAFSLISAFSYIPSAMQSALVKQVAVLASAVITNVSGPAEERYFAGQKIESGMFWAPQSGRVGLGITIFSLGGNVFVGVNADPKVLPDPNLLVACLETEYEEMIS
ncbi:MAG: wax ester/triacylglycerol synthase family O-acyltransferase [Chloroflexota bacterium]